MAHQTLTTTHTTMGRINHVLRRSSSKKNRILCGLFFLILFSSIAVPTWAYWRPSVSPEQQNGTYRAQIERVEDGQVVETKAVGTETTQKKANKLARQEARKANREESNVVADGCPPGVIC